SVPPSAGPSVPPSAGPSMSPPVRASMPPSIGASVPPSVGASTPASGTAGSETGLDSEPASGLVSGHPPSTDAFGVAGAPAGALLPLQGMPATLRTATRHTWSWIRVIDHLLYGCGCGSTSMGVSSVGKTRLFARLVYSNRAVADVMGPGPTASGSLSVR